MKQCFIDVSLCLLADVMRLPNGVVIRGFVPHDDGHWPPDSIRLVLEGEALSNDCQVRSGCQIVVKRPMITGHENGSVIWDWDPKRDET